MAGRASRASPIEPLLALVDEAFDHKAWHGTTLRGSLRGLTARQADWRPARGCHTIHDLVVHAAYLEIRRAPASDRRCPRTLRAEGQ